MQGYSCLMSAALQGHVDIVDLLLSKGAAVNAQADDVGLLAACDRSLNMHMLPDAHALTHIHLIFRTHGWLTQACVLRVSCGHASALPQCVYG